MKPKTDLEIAMLYAAGVDPYRTTPDENTIHAVRGDKSSGVVEYLGRPQITFPELLDEMMELSQYYGTTIMEEKKRAYVGIDNGVSGSIGIIYEDGTYEFHQTPVKKVLDYTKEKKYVNRIEGVALAKLLSRIGRGSMVMVERPMVNPARFVPTMSAIRAYEATIVILETLNLPYEVIDSKSFQKLYLPAGAKGEELKPASLEVGNRLFPETKSHKHKDRDGMLIAAYCKQKHK